MKLRSSALKIGSKLPMESQGLRIVCISDTHNKLPREIPDGDILIHAGDFTSIGTQTEIINFCQFFESLPHKKKIFIAGNHDVSIHSDYYVATGAIRFHRKLKYKEGFDPLIHSKECRTLIQSISPNIFYLEDNSLSLSFPKSEEGAEFILNIFGSPWQPEFCDWAFNLPIGADLKAKWDLIPTETDLLITHGPPFGVLDLCDSGDRAGCPDLLNTVKERVKPRLHVFGHIHETYGTFSDGHTLFVNASTCNLQYRPNNAPIVVNLPFDLSKPATVIE